MEELLIIFAIPVVMVVGLGLLLMVIAGQAAAYDPKQQDEDKQDSTNEQR